MTRVGRQRAARLATVLLAAAWLLGASGGGAGTVEVLFSRGNDAYARGDYGAAADLYRKILGAGIRNSRVYYNLGNACFKSNRIGEAILYYEKELKLDPTDVDARENLRFANVRIRDRVPADARPWVMSLLERGRDVLRIEQVMQIFTGLYLAAMAMAAVWLLAAGRRWAAGVGIAAALLLVLSLVAGGWGIAQARAREASDEAIVLAAKVEVLSGPGSENTLLASVHEGTKVRIHNRRQTWVQVTIPDGRAGWIRREALGVI